MNGGVTKALIFYILFGPAVMLISMMLGLIVVVGIIDFNLNWSSSEQIIKTFSLGFAMLLVLRGIITFIRAKGTNFDRFDWILGYSKYFVWMFTLTTILFTVTYFYPVNIIIFFIVWHVFFVILNLYLHRKPRSPDMSVLIR